MKISEFTKRRANTLNKLIIPEIPFPLHTQILWFDCLCADDISKRNCHEIHSHSFFELHLVFNGTLLYECNGKPIRINENNMLFIPPDTSHRHIECSDDLFKISIAFSLGVQNGITETCRKEGSRVLSFGDDITDTINHILKLSDANNFVIPTLIGGRILEILYFVWNELGIALPVYDSEKSDSRVVVAKKFIEDNKDKYITVEDVSKECCLSQKQLNRIFKNTTGYSLYEYITNTRIDYAKKLLVTSDYSIKEIGYKAGFDSESSFVSFFKRRCGISPGAFKKQCEDVLRWNKDIM